MEFCVNGQPQRCEAPAHTKALYVLRNDLGFKDVRSGCAHGHCGVCTVLVDGRAERSCELPLWALQGRQVQTPAGVGSEDAPHPVQAALIEEQAGQCGYCLSGIVMTAVALVDRPKPVSEQEVRAALDQHLCRCGSHHRIVRAVLKAVQRRHAP